MRSSSSYFLIVERPQELWLHLCIVLLYYMLLKIGGSVVVFPFLNRSSSTACGSGVLLQGFPFNGDTEDIFSTKSTRDK